MKKRGFTYIEVMIALAIFSIFIMFLMNINHNSAKLAEKRIEKLKKLYIAQMEMERWKSDYDDKAREEDEVIEYYIAINENTIDYKDLSGNKFKSISILNGLEGLEENDRFYVKVDGRRVSGYSNYIMDIIILVKNDKDEDDSDGQQLESHIFMN